MFEYKIGNITTSELGINATAIDSNAKIKIFGNNNIGKDGVIIIRVTAEAGNYKVDYYFSGSSSANANVTVEIKQNTTPIGSTTITKDVTANQEVDFVGSSINAFAAGDNISIGIEADTAVTVTPATGTGAYLNIVKI